MRPNPRDRLTFVAAMTGIAYVLHVAAICGGIYFHYVANGSTLKPSIHAFVLDFGGFGLWIPSLGFALIPTAIYFAASAVAARFMSNEQWERVEKLLLYTHGVFPVFTFAFIGGLVAIGD